MNLELCNDPPGKGPVHFYEIRQYWLSNFSSFAVYFGGRRFQTSEHAYQAQKFAKGSAIHHDVAEAMSAHEAMTLARQYKTAMLPAWDDVKRAIMKDIVAAKLSQHKYIQRKLRETGNRELIEVSPIDAYWGWGPNKTGRNELGKIWMELRSEGSAFDS